MTDNSPRISEMLNAILVEPNRELRAAMSRALYAAMNEPEPEPEPRGDDTVARIVQREISGYFKALRTWKENRS